MRTNDFGGAADEIARAMIAPMLAFATSILRATYQGRRKWPARIMEGALLALATVAVKPALMMAGMDQEMAVFCGVFMGFVGVDTLSDWLRRWGDSRLPKRGE